MEQPLPSRRPIAGRCVDIDGDYWHKIGERCEDCGFGIDFYLPCSEQDHQILREKEYVLCMRCNQQIVSDEELKRRMAEDTRICANPKCGKDFFRSHGQPFLRDGYCSGPCYYAHRRAQAT